MRGAVGRAHSKLKRARVVPMTPEAYTPLAGAARSFLRIAALTLVCLPLPLLCWGRRSVGGEGFGGASGRGAQRVWRRRRWGGWRTPVCGGSNLEVCLQPKKHGGEHQLQAEVVVLEQRVAEEVERGVGLLIAERAG